MAIFLGYWFLLFITSFYWGTFWGAVFGKRSPSKINLPLPLWLFSGVLFLGLPTLVGTIKFLSVMDGTSALVSLVVGLLGFVFGLKVGFESYGVH